MANDSTKKTDARNKARLSAMQKVLLTYWIAYGAIRALLYKRIKVSVAIFTVLTFVVARLGFKLLRLMGTGKYDAEGKVVRAGIDVSNPKGHWISYVYDLLYVTHIGLALSLFSSKMLWAFAAIPGAALAVLWTKVIKPWLFASTIQDGTIPQVDYMRQQAQAKQQPRRQRKW